jgi:transketolase
MDPLLPKLKAFNITVPDRHYDGHNTMEILESWEWMKQNQESPLAVVYNTIKGKGISFTENNYKWHGATIDKDTFEKGLAELEAGLNLIRASDEQ